MLGYEQDRVYTSKQYKDYLKQKNNMLKALKNKKRKIVGGNGTGDTPTEATEEEETEATKTEPKPKTDKDESNLEVNNDDTIDDDEVLSKSKPKAKPKAKPNAKTKPKPKPSLIDMIKQKEEERKQKKLSRLYTVKSSILEIPMRQVEYEKLAELHDYLGKDVINYYKLTQSDVDSYYKSFKEDLKKINGINGINYEEKINKYCQQYINTLKKKLMPENKPILKTNEREKFFNRIIESMRLEKITKIKSGDDIEWYVTNTDKKNIINMNIDKANFPIDLKRDDGHIRELIEVKKYQAISLTSELNILQSQIEIYISYYIIMLRLFKLTYAHLDARKKKMFKYMLDTLNIKITNKDILDYMKNDKKIEIVFNAIRKRFYLDFEYIGIPMSINKFNTGETEENWDSNNSSHYLLTYIDLLDKQQKSYKFIMDKNKDSENYGKIKINDEEKYYDLVYVIFVSQNFIKCNLSKCIRDAKTNTNNILHDMSPINAFRICESFYSKGASVMDSLVIPFDYFEHYDILPPTEEIIEVPQVTQNKKRSKSVVVKPTKKLVEESKDKPVKELKDKPVEELKDKSNTVKSKKSNTVKSTKKPNAEEATIKPNVEEETIKPNIVKSTKNSNAEKAIKEVMMKEMKTRGRKLKK